MSVASKEREIREMLDIAEGTKREAFLDCVIAALESRMSTATELGMDVAEAFGCEPDDAWAKVGYLVRDLGHLGGDGHFGTVLALLEGAEDACVRGSFK